MEGHTHLGPALVEAETFGAADTLGAAHGHRHLEGQTGTDLLRVCQFKIVI